MLFKIFLIGFVICFTILCEAEFEERLVGADFGDISWFPYMASLTRFNETTLELKHMCGATILSPNIIITAAHCPYIFNSENSTYFVRVGSSTSNSGGKLFEIKNAIIHENYNHTTLVNDVAMLVLMEEIELSDKAKNIPIATQPRSVGTNCLVTGWGWEDEDAGKSSEILKFADIPILDFETCKKSYAKYITLTESMICVGSFTGGIDSCQYDSGGPLTENGELVGIISFGVGCARENFPGIYTDVFHFADWINDKLKLYSV